MTPRLIAWITLLQLVIIVLGVCITGLLVKMFNTTVGGMPGTVFSFLLRHMSLSTVFEKHPKSSQGYNLKLAWLLFESKRLKVTARTIAF